VSIDKTLERAIESNPKTDPEKVKLQLEAEPNLKPKLQFLQPLMFAVLIYLFAVRIQQLKHLSRAEEENSEFGSLSDDDKRALFAQDETYNFNRSVLDIYFGTCFTALVAFRLAALRRFTVSKQAWFCQNTGVTTIRVQALSIAGNAPSYINIPPSFTDFSMTSDISQLPVCGFSFFMIIYKKSLIRIFLRCCMNLKIQSTKSSKRSFRTKRYL